LRESLAPYRRFVLNEKEKVDDILSRLDRYISKMKQMQASLEEEA
jgi:hypothetical protein